MTIRAFSTANELPTPITLDSYDQVMIGSTAMVLAFGGMAFTSGAVIQVSFTVQGYLGALDQAVLMGTLGNHSEARFTVGRSGTVDAYIGIVLNDVSAVVNNAGLIQGQDTGIVLAGALGETSRIDNSGTIHGWNQGIYSTSMSGAITIVNSGTISAGIGQEAIWLGDSADTVVNSGTISGLVTVEGGNDTLDNDGGRILGSVEMGSGHDLVANSGRISGDVLLSDGDDTLENTGGRIQGTVDAGAGIDLVVNSGVIVGYVDLGGDNDVYETVGAGVCRGTIYGGAGNDRFIVGLAQETYVGDIGSDYLDFRKTGGVTVALDGSVEGTGAAEGDSYSGIEHVYGSRNGGDVLIGSTVANRLFGIGGSDSLNGLAGADSLDGGQGIDTLTGGLGNDTFVFMKVAQADDIITDFSSTGAGNNDQIAVSAAGFGGGLVAGVLSGAFFQSRADNVAQDADDRFIFNTTSRTVWFDADGTGALGPVLVATLQALADFTAADVLVIA
jgi:Ca2+-binding RTX toxin-like protein